jgi:predicted fused transcriptional regulator/phosphomethylpyrimidine kinase
MNLDRDRLKAALVRLHTDPQPVQIEMSKADVFALIGTVQLAGRHPNAKDSPSIQASLGLARQLIDAIAANDPDLRMLCNMGFEKQFDEPIR